MTLAEHEAAEAARKAAAQATKPVQQPAARPAGYYSNERIIHRNGGVRPQFINDIGGCSENYR